MRTILQVEDDPNDVLFLRRAMNKVGVSNRLCVARDGREAIDYLLGVGKYADRERFPLPYLVLLDLKLPQIMGLEVLKWIRHSFGMSIVVVILSASGEEQDITCAYQFFANAFLTKPSEACKLEVMVKAINDFWLTCNRSPTSMISSI